MRIPVLFMIVIFLCTPPGLLAADAYQKALARTLSKYGTARDVPAQSLRWLAHRFDKSPETLASDLEREGLEATSPAPRKPIELKGPRIIFLRKVTLFEAAITNTGRSPMTKLGLHLPLPLQFSDSRSAARELHLELGDLAAGKSKRVSIPLNSIRKGTASLEATLSYCTEGFSTEQRATASLKTTVLGVATVELSTYDTEDPCAVGTTTTYVIEARNTGSSPCTNVNLSNTIPDEMEFISASFPGKGKREGKRLIFGPYPILEPGRKLTYKIKCKALRPASAKNKAELRFDQFERTILDEEGTSIYK